MNSREWLESLSSKDKTLMQQVIGRVVDFSHSSEQGHFFDTCGLYAVGSSLTKKDPKDIDITLVGLDFRAVFDYDGVFLQDPETLVKEGVVSQEGAGYTREPILFNGRKNFYVPQPGYDSLDTYTESTIQPSKLVDRLATKLGVHTVFEGNPLQPYNSLIGKFLVFRLDLGKVDFSVHAENLFPKFWKRHQERQGLPYVTLHEWPGVNSTAILGRSIFHNTHYPDFIDLNGRKRVEGNFESH